MKVPFMDLKVQYQSIKVEMDFAIQDVIDNNDFIGGKNLKNFEDEFAKFCNVKHCIGVSNGTSAIELALKAAGIKFGDEVITVPNTFIATSEAITAIGAKVRFVDCDEHGLMDASKLTMTQRTKAIIPVHLYGQVCDMDAIHKFASKHNLIVLEDCAQAHGATYNGKTVPVNGFGTFSFYPGKNLGAYGDAGAVVCNDDTIAENVKMFRDHGRKTGEKYLHAIEASNYRMDALQARVLSVKLKHLATWTLMRQKNAKIYLENLDCECVTTSEEAVYHLFVIYHKDRDELQKFLKDNYIDTGIHYPIPLHLQPAYEYLRHKVGDFPNAERLSKKILSLPMFPEMTREQIEYVCSKIKEYG